MLATFVYTAANLPWLNSVQFLNISYIIFYQNKTIKNRKDYSCKLNSKTTNHKTKKVENRMKILVNIKQRDMNVKQRILIAKLGISKKIITHTLEKSFNVHAIISLQISVQNLEKC